MRGSTSRVLTASRSMQRGLCIGGRLVRPLKSATRAVERLRQPLLCVQRSEQQSVSRHLMTNNTMAYSIIEKGCPNTLEYRVFFTGPKGIISPFHDIPLFANKEQRTYNMVVEVPRWTNAKMEIDTSGKLNPIKQDVKKGKLRFVHNCFPHHGYIWNYGALPQTWEDPTHKDEHTGQLGDNDPLDVCEIGHKVHKRGTVIEVKVLGIMAMIDEGETDWKVLAIDTSDPLAGNLNDVDDIEKHMPGFLKATNEWFRIYKIPAGKPENQFAFNGEAKDKDFAHNVISETHGFWQKLVGKQTDAGGLSCENISVSGSPYNISQEDAKSHLETQPPYGQMEPIADEVDKWHYVKL